MSANKKLTTMGVFQDTLSTFRELSEKTKIPLLQLMDEIAKEIKTMLSDGLPENSRMNFMASHSLKNSAVILYFSTMTCGIGDVELKNLLERKPL